METLKSIIADAAAAAEIKLAADFEHALPGFLAVCTASELVVTPLPARQGFTFLYKECALFVGFKERQESWGRSFSLYYFGDAGPLPCDKELLAKMLSLLLVERVDNGSWPANPGDPPLQYSIRAIENPPTSPARPKQIAKTKVLSPAHIASLQQGRVDARARRNNAIAPPVTEQTGV